MLYHIVVYCRVILSILQAIMFALYTLALALIIAAIAQQPSQFAGSVIIGFAIYCVAWLITLAVLLPTTLVTHSLNPCGSSRSFELY